MRIALNLKTNIGVGIRSDILALQVDAERRSNCRPPVGK